MFKRLHDETDELVTITIEDRPVRVPSTYNVAAAVLSHSTGPTRTTSISGAPRAPYCMMGVCFDCLMEIDGIPNRQACLVPVAEGMQIRRQEGARDVKP